MKSKTTTLATAATAATALFALQSHADASIVYSDPNIVLTAPGFGYFTAQIHLGAGGTFIPRVHKAATVSGSVFGRASIFPGSKNQWLHAPTHGYFIGKLAPNALIGPSAGPWNNPKTDTGGVLRRFRSGSRTGQWVTGQVGFAGVRISVGGGNYDYGWIRMEVQTDADGVPDILAVNDFAYQTTPNTAINAGAVPEPSTTTLMALAGAGAAFLRRRRESKEVFSV
jgi:hypothetical protein